MIKLVKDLVIYPHMVPWIHNIGPKNEEQAKGYIRKTSEKEWNNFIVMLTMIQMNKQTPRSYKKHIEDTEIFRESKIDKKLSEIIGENVYKPYKFYSEFNQFDINKNMGLISKVDGVTKNNETIILRNNYYKQMYNNTYDLLELQMLAAMAVWQAKKGIVYLSKLERHIEFEFNQDKWDNIVLKIKSWADNINIEEYTPFSIEEVKEQFKLNISKIEKICSSPDSMLG